MEFKILFSFSVGILGFALLCFQLLRHRLDSPFTLSMFATGITSIVWCIAHMLVVDDPDMQAAYIIMSEQIRNGALLATILSILSAKNLAIRIVKVTCHLPWLSAFLLSLVASFGSSLSTKDLIQSNLLAWLMIATPIIALILAEQAYRNTEAKFIDGMRFIYIGIAGLFAYDLYFFVHLMLFQELDPNIAQTRGAIAAIVALLLLIGVNRLQEHHLVFQMSRSLVFYSTSLVATGAFLFLMASGGYYIRTLGGSWGILFQSVLLFSTVTLGLILASSKKARAHLKVLIAKHLFRHRYDYREEWLRLIKTLTDIRSKSSIYTNSIKALAQIFESESGALWMLHDNQVHTLSAEVNRPDAKDFELEADSEAHRYMENTRFIIVTDEYLQHPERYEGLIMPEWLLQKQNWIVIPLIYQDRLVGFISLGPPPVRRRLEWEDFDLLKTASAQIAGFLASEQTSKALAESKQFDAYSRLTAFIMHDLKNLIAQQSLVVKNAGKHKDNPEFIEDAINTIDNSVKRMSRLLDQLKQNESSENNSICLNHLLVEAARKCHHREPRPSLNIPDEELRVQSSAEQLAMIFGHVIRNAQEATKTNGFIDVTLSKQDDFALVEVEDNGHGMSQTFIRERLFRPFDTTKSSKGMGIGAYQTREFIRQAGGDVSISSEEGIGTKFSIYLPLENTMAAKQARNNL